MPSACTSNGGRIALTATVAAARLAAAASVDGVGVGSRVTEGDGDAAAVEEGDARGDAFSVTLTPHAAGSAARPAAARSSSARVRIFISVPPRQVGRQGRGTASRTRVRGLASPVRRGPAHTPRRDATPGVDCPKVRTRGRDGYLQD